MKAVLVEKIDDRYQLAYKDVPIPTPKEGQVIVKNHFIGKHTISPTLMSTIIDDPSWNVQESTFQTQSTTIFLHNLHLMCLDVKGNDGIKDVIRDHDLIVYRIYSAGEVTAVGANVDDIKVGDRVAHVSFNAYSEYAALDANQVAKIPDNVSYKDAAAASAQALTALTLVRHAYPVKKGGK